MEKSCEKRKILEENDEALVISTDISDVETLSKKRKLRNRSHFSSTHNKKCSSTLTVPSQLSSRPLISLKPPRRTYHSTDQTQLQPQKSQQSKTLSTPSSSQKLKAPISKQSLTPKTLQSSSNLYLTPTNPLTLDLPRRILPHSSLPKAKSECISCKENSNALAKMYGLMSDMSRQILRNAELLQQILKEKPTSVISTIHSYKDTGLPLTSMNELIGLNERLKDEQIIRKMVAYLGVFGGKDITTATRTVLTKTIANSLALKLNWIGGDKKSICEFERVLLMITLAVKANFASVQGSDVDAILKPWLRNASDREGGRARRRRARQESSDESDHIEEDVRQRKVCRSLNDKMRVVEESTDEEIFAVSNVLPLGERLNQELDDYQEDSDKSTGNHTEPELTLHQQTDTDNIPIITLMPSRPTRHDWRRDTDRKSSDDELILDFE